MDPTFFDADPLQPGEVHLHLWMLYTPQAPILDLTGEHIKTKEDIKAVEFTSAIVQAILTMLNCRLKVIIPYNHGSSKCKRQIKTISEIIVKHLWDYLPLQQPMQ